jgi:glycosyltransferase involved in cell wall biosynthesis
LVAQRLEPEKHTRDALEAWRASGLASDGWILRIAGDGSERGALEREAIDRELLAVEFLGHRADLPDLRRVSGILLATAAREPFGLSVAEAMAAGMPVVAAGSGGHLETVGAARPDLVYVPGDPHAAARTLRTLADDLEARRSAGHDLRAFQQRELNLDRHVDALVELYRGLPMRRRLRQNAER